MTRVEADRGSSHPVPTSRSVVPASGLASLTCKCLIRALKALTALALQTENLAMELTPGSFTKRKGNMFHSWNDTGIVFNYIELICKVSDSTQNVFSRR